MKIERWVCDLQKCSEDFRDGTQHKVVVGRSHYDGGNLTMDAHTRECAFKLAERWLDFGSILYVSISKPDKK